MECIAGCGSDSQLCCYRAMAQGLGLRLWDGFAVDTSVAVLPPSLVQGFRIRFRV